MNPNKRYHSLTHDDRFSRPTTERLRELLGGKAKSERAHLGEDGSRAENSRIVEALRRMISRMEEGADHHERQPAEKVEIQDIVEGVFEETPHGDVFVASTEVSLTNWRGDSGPVIEGTNQTVPPLLARIARNEALSGRRLSEFVYLDTETTGLATTSGTYAFLTGLGYVDGDSFRVDQLFMRDYGVEPAYLWLLGERLAKFAGVVTYNGRAFDIPLLQARFITNRVFDPPIPASHLDMLGPARRLWRTRGSGCRLTELESEVLGVSRQGDVPGHLIPNIYFQAVRSGNAAPLQAVFYHNMEDILSLAGLTSAAVRLVDPDDADYPEIGEDLYGLARVLEEVGDHKAGKLYGKAIERGFRSPIMKEEALCRFGLYHRKAGNVEGALELFTVLARDGWAFKSFGLIEISKYLEHKKRAFEQAAEAAQAALQVLVEHEAKRVRIPAFFRPKRKEIEHRLARLEARKKGKPWRKQGAGDLPQG